MRRLRSFRSRISRGKLDAVARIEKDFQEFLSAGKIIKAWRLETFCTDRFGRDAATYIGQSLNEVKFNNLIRLVLSFIGVIMISLIIFMARQRLASAGHGPGNYMGFILAAWLFYRPVRQLTTGYANLVDGMVAANRVLDLVAGADQDEGERTSGRLLDAIQAIEFRQASFAYDGRTVLDQANLGFEKGNIYLLCGPNGAGKTTLLESLMGFVDALTGSILINGVPMETFSLSSIRSRLSWVPQEMMLFDGSFRENILLDKAWVDLDDTGRQRYAWALETSQLKDALDRSQRDDLSGVDQKGVNLSGGEKQRVSIARALFKDHDVLILDEPATHLQQGCFDLVLSRLAENIGDRMVLLVAHTDRYNHYADIVYRFDGGKICRTSP
jgi:subfamily B ATP-binding cassette protein MsbA